MADQDQNDVNELSGSQIRFECNDTLDNDGDGFVDHPADPECASETSAAEAPRACGIGAELVGVIGLLREERRRRVRRA